MEPRKNLFNVIRALEGTAVPVVVVGKKKKKYFTKIQKEISRGGVTVYFPENVSTSELAAIYQLSDMLVYPSMFEGFGIPVIEALFSGIPVITSNLSSLPEAGGAGGLYVHPDNAADMRAKILFLWDNESERRRLAEKGLDYVQKFSDERIAKNL